ncbi:MAG: 50S ribosomal protein L35 [Candidatus Auribacterota bacterium]|jgi:large subunit ribosomal protein L35|uniref:Large ribosomal subunit protein bL35 n=1 Tax=Candidatus Auribacter fodinae TaxID=2093366 RepID=A0A3A4R2G6_9BACT|nr:MAG: 50S ribosomal protein L35 [Candidatus Auribacter fodinae]
MPKLKTNKGAAKRFKVTAKGKVKASSAFSNHILTKKSSKRKRQLRKGSVLDPVNTKKVKAMLPHA